MNKNPIEFTAEFSDAMVSTYETWAEPLSARLAKVALGKTTVSFMDTLEPIIYRIFPTYGSLDEHLRGELRILLAEEVRRWTKQDVPAGRAAKVHLAIARRLYGPLQHLVSEVGSTV